MLRPNEWKDRCCDKHHTPEDCATFRCRCANSKGIARERATRSFKCCFKPLMLPVPTGSPAIGAVRLHKVSFPPVPDRFTYSEVNVRCWEATMKEQVRRSESQTERRETTSRTSIWRWLSRTGNQKTLRFLGAAIAASVGILVTTGLIHKTSDAPAAAPASSAPPTTATSPREPTNVFYASATGGGDAVNIQSGGPVNIQNGETRGHRK